MFSLSSQFSFVLYVQFTFFLISLLFESIKNRPPTWLMQSGCNCSCLLNQTILGDLSGFVLFDGKLWGGLIVSNIWSFQCLMSLLRMGVLCCGSNLISFWLLSTRENLTEFSFVRVTHQVLLRISSVNFIENFWQILPSVVESFRQVLQ